MTELSAYFSDAFDALINSYDRGKDFGDGEKGHSLVFDEYEKSLLLTKAQEEIVLGLFTGRNFMQNSFEETEELRRYLSDLVAEYSPMPITNSDNRPLGIPGGTSYFYALKDDVWFITFESVTISNEGKCNNGATLEVLPITQDEYHRIKKNPFRGANGRRALRLDLGDNIVELKCMNTISSYYIRYVKKLEPIVLIDLTNDDDPSVQGVRQETPCKLHKSLYQKIIDRAVELALQSRASKT